MAFLLLVRKNSWFFLRKQFSQLLDIHLEIFTTFEIITLLYKLFLY